jgi:cell division transport system ATP-binding protein
MITFDSVTKKFSSKTAGIEDVSFTINANEFVFLVGTSGAGKTTILRLILGELAPTSGNITVNDWNITRKSFRELHLLRRDVGMVFQDFKLLPYKNVLENIALSLQIQRINSAYIKQEVGELLELVGLSGRELQFPQELSAGEQQRVAIARALAGGRNIILADEPTGNLDPKTAWEIMKIFKKLEGEKTVIITTHNLDFIETLKKRTITMENGKIINDEEAKKEKSKEKEDHGKKVKKQEA